MTENNPWLALGTYEEKDKDKFKGREQDTQNMLKMLQQNEYVVCYAASGDGKSSLINAGVCPEMRKVGYYPIKIVFSTDEYEGINISRKEDGKIDFDAYILRRIEELINLTNRRINKSESQIIFEVDDQFASFPSDLSSILWWKLRTQTIQMPHGEFDYIPVLIFDQFEEILRARWKNEFFEWLETLSSDECPDAIYSSVSDYEKLPSRKKFKAIFSMRYEYVGELDYWTSQRYFIPQMMRGRYFLKPFTIEQAELIIKAHQSDDVASQQLSINANNIASNLADTDNNVSAIMLSLLSYILYEQWSQDKDYEFTPQNVARLMFTHYENILSRCKISDKERNALESALISSNGARRRMPLSDERLSIFAVDAGNSKIEDLVKEHILRQNDDYIELVHDRLVEAIYEGNKKRKEEELIQRKKRTRSRIVYGLLFCAILGLIGWVLYYSLAKVPYVERISGDCSDKNLLCKDTLFIDGNSIIREYCFYGNPTVKNIVIQGDKVFIEKNAFGNCGNLNSIHIIANDCFIDSGAFTGTKISKIVAEGTNIKIGPIFSNVDTIERLHVKGNGNFICMPTNRKKYIRIFDVEGSNNTLGFHENEFQVGYLQLANANQLYWDYLDNDSTIYKINIDDLDILRGTSFDINSDFGLLEVQKLFLEDKRIKRINDTILAGAPLVFFKKEVDNERNPEKYIRSTHAISPKDNVGYSVSVDEFVSASETERWHLCEKALSFHGHNDSCYAYGNVIYITRGNAIRKKITGCRVAELAKVIKVYENIYYTVNPETKDIYILDPQRVQYLRCKSDTTLVHVPYGYGEYCRSDDQKFSNCTIVEMSVFETIYERLLFSVVELYHLYTFFFYYRILLLLAGLCLIVYYAKKKKNEEMAFGWTLGLLFWILVLAWSELGMPIRKDLLGNPEIWVNILAIGQCLLALGIIIWLVYERKRAKKYAIVFGSDESKKAAFSIVDKIYKEGGKEKDVFLVSNYKKDWDFKKHRWTKNTIVLLTKEELLEKDSEYVKFLSHLKTTGYIRPIVLGVASNQDIVWPRELRKFGRRYNLLLFKAIAFQSKNLRETDLDEVYRYITKRWDKRIIKSRLLVYVIIGVVFFGLYEIGIIWDAPII
ncbi:MAG: leucine-rich repeat domain-containing protein [Bacteroidales bacterium]|nr:leucine-rich repeat domain-containing protein [Bacteroidales bacterium]